VRQKRPKSSGTLELSRLAIEKLWKFCDEPLFRTDFVPQADDLELAYGLLRTRLPDLISSHDLEQAFELHGRHAAYTLEALRELGLLRRYSNKLLVRTPGGSRIADSSEAVAYREFVRAVLRLPIVRLVLSELRIHADGRILRASIVGLIQTACNRRYSGRTLDRRATTVIAWLLWLENNVWFAEGVP
jgi:hypothetical protein